MMSPQPTDTFAVQIHTEALHTKLGCSISLSRVVSVDVAAVYAGSTTFDFFCPRTGVTDGLCRVYTASPRFAKVSRESCQASPRPPHLHAVRLF